MDTGYFSLYYSDMPEPGYLSAIRFRSGRLVHCAPDWNWQTGALPDMDLWLVLSGRIRVRGWFGMLAGTAGHCFLFRRGARYSATHDPADPLVVIVFHFDFADTSLRMEQLPFRCRTRSMPILHGLAMRAIEASGAGRADEADAWAQVVVAEFLRQAAASYPPGPAGEQAERIDRICTAISQRPGRRWRVPELARELGVTPDHFARLFRKQRGETPQQYILRHRIQTAQSLLLNSSHTVGRVAELLGYENIYFFSRQFRAKTGMSPSAFRKGPDK